MPVSLNETLRNTRADAITTFAGNGAKLRVYSAAYATQLLELTCGTPFAAAASGGVLTLTVSGSTASAAGTAAIARIYKSDGTTVVVEGLTVGLSGANINLTSVSLSAGDAVSVTSATITEGNA
jgi:hypothetical protein